MIAYTLPRSCFELLKEAFGDNGKAEIFAKAIEQAIIAIDEKAKEVIVEKKEMIKVEVREELKKELVTREIFEERFNMVDERFNGMKNWIEERFNVVDERFKSLNFRLNIFIAIALLALTLCNPAFVKLLERFF
ncbi:MAG: hypothetical protein AB1422_16565 [bacterium]